MKNKEQILLRMREDIRLRGLSENTLESYTLHARVFLEYSNRPAEQLAGLYELLVLTLRNRYISTLSSYKSYDTKAQVAS